MTLNNKFDRELLGKIKEKQLTPMPKWQFLLKNYVVWGAGLISLLIGAAAISVVIYISRYNDWGIYKQIGDSAAGFILLTMPYFWLIFLTLFIFIMYYNIKHTDKGYRYPVPAILTGAIAATVLLGVLFYGAGLGQAIDDVLGQKAPFYDRMINPRINYWSRPGEGRLTGLIISRPNENEIVLVDRSRREWKVFIKSDKLESGVDIQAGKPICLLGRKISKNEFKAEQILQMRTGREFFHRFGPSFFQPPEMPAKPKDFYRKSPERRKSNLCF